MTPGRGRVHFIGAGPGAADLLTLRAAKLLAACPVCVFAGALVPPEVLDHCPPRARLVDTQHLDLDAIVAEIERAHDAGEDVARLQSGDLSLYSAVAEQTRRLDALGIPWTMTPGVTAFAAASSALRRELTAPNVAQTVVLTRYARQATKRPEDLGALAAAGGTLVLHLGVQAIEELVAELEPHYGAGCPAAVVARASRDDELVLQGTLADIAGQVREADVTRTAVIVVGWVLAGEDHGSSHLYSKRRAS